MTKCIQCHSRNIAQGIEVDTCNDCGHEEPNARYDDEDKAAQPNGCRHRTAFCNRPADHMVHNHLYWGNFIPSYGVIGHQHVPE